MGRKKITNRGPKIRVINYWSPFSKPKCVLYLLLSLANQRDPVTSVSEESIR